MTSGTHDMKVRHSSTGREIRSGLKNMAVDSLIDVMQGENAGQVAEKQLKKAATSVLKQAKSRQKVAPKKAKRSRKRRPIRPLFDEHDGDA